MSSDTVVYSADEMRKLKLNRLFIKIKERATKEHNTLTVYYGYNLDTTSYKESDSIYIPGYTPEDRLLLEKLGYKVSPARGDSNIISW